MALKFYYILALVFLVMIELLSLGICQSTADDIDLSKGASFIFGDSLVDAGNNDYLQTLSKADTPPNGIDLKASGGNPTGRFTNGRTIGDIVGEELGQPRYALPFLAPNTTGKVILYGVNYASGGGGIMNATGSIFVNRLSMDIQVDYFNITRKQIYSILGASKAKQYLNKQSIFSITIGSNDFLNNYLLPVVSMGARIRQSPDAFVNDMINHLRGQLTRLYHLDARKFIVGNVGPIGCIPYQRTINQLKENECVSLPNELATRYNGKLKALVEELNKDLQGATFVFANVYDLVMELITNSAKYGFTKASAACCSSNVVSGQFSGMIPCTPTSTLCSNHDDYVFWDNYHPSQAANLIIAKQLLDGGTQYVSPINVRQLRQL